MVFKFITGLRNIKISNKDKDINLGKLYRLSNDIKSLEDKFFSETFLVKVGLNKIDFLCNNSYIYIISDDNVLKEYFKENNIAKLLDMCSQCLQHYMLSLWLIKDNSVNMDMSYLYIPEQNIVLGNTRYILFSDSSGEYKITQFTDEEIETSADIFNLFLEDRIKQNNGNKNNKETSTQSVLNFNFNRPPFSDENRIGRAIHYITLARSQSILPNKISFYTAFLETLFTTDSTEISHKVSERAAKFLGGEFETIKDNYILFKSAYDIRSKYMHGQKLNKKYKNAGMQKIVEVSNIIDILCREILSRVLIEYSQIFSSYTEKQLDEWFIDLVLK